MSQADTIALWSFVLAVIAGWMLLTFQGMRKNQPNGRIHSRMQEFAVVTSKTASDFDASLFTFDKRDNAWSRWANPRISRLKTVAGAAGIRIVIGATVVGELIALAMTHFMPLPDFAPPLLWFGLPLFLGMRAYNFLVERFRKRFLDGFPDLLDMIVRAVRAGVPVTHVIGTAADECPEPLKKEFRLMGDSLKVGRDLEEVLAVGIKRIEIADFSFFCVCLLLQRETGGQLGETLENLASIVRTRREVRQKTKALTAEARITTKILASIPVCIMGALYLTNPDYIDVLFDREAGHKILTFAVISIAFGILAIGKLSKLDTSR